jgi:hypothetical protein
MQAVLASYKRTASLQKTADEMGFSYAKVRKILITLGEYQTAFSLDVGNRRRMGQSISEIAAALKTSTNRVTAFLPYENGLYAGPELTTDAIKSKIYRKRIRIAREKFVNKTTERGDKADRIMRKEKSIMDTDYSKKETFSAVHLHLELRNENLDDEAKAILRKYGESSTGDSISRDILIPSDMPLHNLHYAMQRLFGWQNSHLRRFILPDEVYSRLTGDTVRGWVELVGILFQPPGEQEQDIFWDDDYQSGSIKSWLRKKYTGPYSYHGVTEHYEWAQNDIRKLIEQYPMLEVRESFGDYLERSKAKSDIEPRIIKEAPLIELTLEELNDSTLMLGGTDHLLERLEAASVLAFRDEDISDADYLFPVAHTLIYNYDFGDDWNVIMTKERDCSELLQKGHITQDELREAEKTVLTRYMPVCIHRDGVFVFDDVGGLRGFAKFLKEINEGENKEERRENIIWAQSLGWSQRKISNKMIL